MKGVYFLQISDNHTEEFWEAEEIILTRELCKQLDNPQLHVCLPSDYHLAASSRGRDAMGCAVFFCSLSHQRLACPLSESGRRAPAFKWRQETTGLAVSSQSNDIMWAVHNYHTVGQTAEVWQLSAERHSSIYGYPWITMEILFKSRCAFTFEVTD